MRIGGKWILDCGKDTPDFRTLRGLRDRAILAVSSRLCVATVRNRGTHVRAHPAARRTLVRSRSRRQAWSYPNHTDAEPWARNFLKNAETIIRASFAENRKMSNASIKPQVRWDLGWKDRLPISSFQSTRRPCSLATCGGIALFFRHRPNASRSKGSPCFNSKLSHLVNQRSTRQSKPIGRSSLSSDQPVRLPECLQDVLSLGIGQCACSTLRDLLHRGL